MEDGERPEEANKTNRSPAAAEGGFGRRAPRRRCSHLRGEIVFIVIINYRLVNECTRVDPVRVPCNRGASRSFRRAAETAENAAIPGAGHRFPAGRRDGGDRAPQRPGPAELEEERRRAVGRIGAAGFVPSSLPRGNPAHRETHLGSFRQFFFLLFYFLILFLFLIFLFCLFGLVWFYSCFYNKRKRCSQELAASFSVCVRMRFDRSWTTPNPPVFRLPPSR